jgi:hypothetical protein
MRIDEGVANRPGPSNTRRSRALRDPERLDKAEGRSSGELAKPPSLERDDIAVLAVAVDGDNAGALSQPVRG